MICKSSRRDYFFRFWTPFLNIISKTPLPVKPQNASYFYPQAKPPKKSVKKPASKKIPFMFTKNVSNKNSAEK